MGQRFTDYCASNITPQMTLLEKLNAIIEFLKNYDEEQTHLYLHKYNVGIGTLEFISNSKKEFEMEEIEEIFSKVPIAGMKEEVIFNPIIHFGILSDEVNANVVYIKQRTAPDLGYNFYYVEGVNQIDSITESDTITNREIISL